MQGDCHIYHRDVVKSLFSQQVKSTAAILAARQVIDSGLCVNPMGKFPRNFQVT